MEFPKVTIIVPVYNAINTIKKCLNSIIAQTLKDWELILVNDGSLDGSGHICDEYAIQDSRFKVIHQENAGVSAARQIGLEVAKGEYIIHADPDDWVEPQMLEKLYVKAKTDDADMVICDFIIEFDDKSSYSKQCPSSLDSKIVLNDMFGKIHGSCCNKLVKRACIEHCKAKFPEGVNYCEDVCFNVQLLRNDIKVSYINEAYYHYIQYQTSITNKYTIESFNTQKKYVTFLTAHLTEDSFPVIQAKELVKKLAFKSSVVSNDVFYKLYPEIKITHDNSIVERMFYFCVFSNCKFLVKTLRKFYFKANKINKH